jgi:RsmE family RNA methyltransferase
MTEKGERSYSASRLWTEKEYRNHLIHGAEMAFTTRIPEVVLPTELEPALNNLPNDRAKGQEGTGKVIRPALDNYEAEVLLGGLLAQLGPLSGAVIAVGPERGWSARERRMLKGRGFVLAGMGDRVLRTETASLAAIALVLTRMGLM